MAVKPPGSRSLGILTKQSVPTADDVDVSNLVFSNQIGIDKIDHNVDPWTKWSGVRAR